ncbi:MAG TPA: peptidylprolyl isomerase, partial [Pyrinomonadaceae bacterium]
MNRARVVSSLIGFLLLSLTACNSSKTNSNGANSNANAGAASKVKSAQPIPDSQIAVIETAEYGRIVIELYPNIAPQHVERFKRLINEKFYDGSAIHRID